MKSAAIFTYVDDSNDEMSNLTAEIVAKLSNYPHYRSLHPAIDLAADKNNIRVAALHHAQYIRKILNEYKSKYDYIIFLDGDAYPLHTDSFDKLIKATADKTIAGIKGYIKLPTLSRREIEDLLTRNGKRADTDYWDNYTEGNSLYTYAHPAVLCIPTKIIDQYQFLVDLHNHSVLYCLNEYLIDRYIKSPYGIPPHISNYRPLYDTATNMTVILEQTGVNPNYVENEFIHCWGYYWIDAKNKDDVARDYLQTYYPNGDIIGTVRGRIDGKKTKQNMLDRVRAFHNKIIGEKM